MFIIYLLLSPLSLILAHMLKSKMTKVSLINLLREARFWLSSLSSVAFCYLAVTVTHLDFTAILNFDFITLLVYLCAAVFFAAIKLILSDAKATQSTLSFLLASLCIAIFLEAIIFNMRAYQTYYYEPIDLMDKTEISSNLQSSNLGNNKYTANAGANATFEILDIDEKIHNIYFDVSATDALGNVFPITVRPSFTDESNELYISTPSQTVTSDVESTKYLYFVTNGTTEKLKLYFSSDGTQYTV